MSKIHGYCNNPSCINYRLISIYPEGFCEICEHTIQEINPIYDIITAFKLLYTKYESNPLYSATYACTILSKLRNIFGSKATAEVFTYFCQHDAATAQAIRNELDMSEATTHRVLKELRSLGFIIPMLKASKPKNSKGGPRPTVWALASSDESAGAVKLAIVKEEVENGEI